MTVRAGWIIQYRVHGLTSDKPRLLLEGRLGPDGAVVALEFASTPTFRAEVFRPFRVLEVGQSHKVSTQEKPVPAPAEDGYFACYLWLTVSVLEEFDVPESVEKAFRQNPTKHQDALVSQLEPRMAHLYLAAKIAAAACAVEYETSVLELWAELPAYYYDATHYRTSMSIPITVVKRQPLAPASLNLLVRRVQAVLRLGNDTTKPLLLAGHWLLSARQAGATTYERFTGFFRVLETLSWIADNPESAADRDRFDRLERLVAQTDADLGPFVRQLKEAGGRPSAAAQFGAMAMQFSPATAEADIQLFRDLNQIRGQLVHGRITRIPPKIGQRDTFTEIERLAHHYLGVLLAAKAQV